MIADELSDFEAYWRRCFWDEDGDARGQGEVDYSELQAWSKGNSFSVDQSTITMGRRLMTLLGDRLKDCLIKSDEGLKAERHWGKEAGATITDLEREAAFDVRMGHKFGRKVNERWYRIESILQEMFLHENIELYQTEDTLIGRQEKSDFKLLFTETTAVESEKRLIITAFLGRNKDAGGHIRLSHVSKRWDIYIRDRYGAPPGIIGVLPGDLEVGLQLGPKYLQMDLHMAYGETISRKVSQFSGKERGKGHYVARAKICDLAANNDGVISLDAYYRLFARASAEHMADYYLTRSIGDSSAAEFTIREIPDSDPKGWDVVVDTGLIRWRELSRERARERGEEGGDGVNSSTQGGV
tara:strand:+ start:877 stop:1941 length:1065 start_codon:yes stop_codon:yes gene_type:complete